jgi:hypothetical protein
MQMFYPIDLFASWREAIDAAHLRVSGAVER